MKKITALSLLALISMSSAFAQDSDLTIPNQKWVATFNKYICAASGPAVTAPSAFSQYQVSFDKITTDSTLDNGLLKATFVEDGQTCRYSAIVFADNAAFTLRLVESRAYAPTKRSHCAAGKAVLDAAFESNNYLYYGHPHNLGIMVPVAGVEAVCPGAAVMGVNFVVTGRIQ